MPSRDFRSLAHGSPWSWMEEAKGYVEEARDYVDHAGGFLKRSVVLHVRKVRREHSAARATSDLLVSLNVG
jgi:hypothetical protein